MRRSQYPRLVLCLGLSLSALAPACAMDSEDIGVTDEEIVGGNATTIAEHPWQISLTSLSGSHFCGGSILSPSWVATAQHCVDGGSADMRVVAGITRRSQQASGQIRAFDAITTFPGFTDPTEGRDVSLLHLATPLDLSGTNARAIPLVTAADASAGATSTGVVATVTGWGTLTEGGQSLPDVLQEVDVHIVSNAEASADYGFTISADQLAAGEPSGGKDSCQGDSGGPLTVQFGGATKLAGAVSWGNGCAEADFPGLYGRISSFASYVTARVNGGFSKLLALTGLSGARNSFTHRSFTVPAGALALSVIITGGSGDADLYVRQGAQPTTGQFNCRPFLGGNSEFCTIDAPASGTWFASIRGFAAYSGASLSVAVVTP
jgi:secreted trypsin-like serine protease